MKNKAKKILIGLLIAGSIFGIYYSGVVNFFTFATFKANRAFLLQTVQNHYWVTVLAYILLYIFIVISTLPLAGFLTIISGFLFNALPGTIYSVFAGTIGCTFAFLLYRYFFGTAIQNKYKKKLEHFNKRVDKYGALYVFLIQLVGLIPFFVVNTMASVTKIPLRSFTLATAIGIIPITAIYAYSGKQLGNINEIGQLFSGKIVIAASLLLILFFMSFMFKKSKLAGE